MPRPHFGSAIVLLLFPIARDDGSHLTDTVGPRASNLKFSQWAPGHATAGCPSQSSNYEVGDDNGAQRPQPARPKRPGNHPDRSTPSLRFHTAPHALISSCGPPSLFAVACLFVLMGEPTRIPTEDLPLMAATRVHRAHAPVHWRLRHPGWGTSSFYETQPRFGVVSWQPRRDQPWWSPEK